MKNVNRFRSQSGSTLLIVMAAVLVVGLVAAAALQFASSGTKRAQSAANQAAMFSMIQTLQAIAGNDKACLGQGALKGLEFKTSSGSFHQNGFDPVAAQSSSGQDISIGTQLDNSGGTGGNPFQARAGNVYGRTGFGITKLTYYVTSTPAALTYSGTVTLQGTANFGLPNAAPLAPRNIGTLSITIDASNNLLSCQYVQSAQTECEAMGCIYNPGNPGQKCLCGFPPVSCPATPGQPRQYITSIDQSTSPVTAVCSTFQVDCSDPAHGGKGPGFFFAGFDTSGNPICVPVEGYVSGSSSNPVNGTCGPAASAPQPDAATATAAGLCGSGTASPSSLSGAGPWSWTCSGANGGLNASCSTTSSSAVPLCGGLPKPSSPGPIPACGGPLMPGYHWISCGGKHWVCTSGVWTWEIYDVCGTSLVHCP